MENELDLTIKKLRKLLDMYNLPSEMDEALRVAKDFDTLRDAKIIIKTYRDE